MTTFVKVVLYLSAFFFIIAGLISSYGSTLGGFALLALAAIFEMLCNIRDELKHAAERAKGQSHTAWPQPRSPAE